MKVNRISGDKTSESLYKYYKQNNRDTAYDYNRVYTKDYNNIIKNIEQLIDKNKTKMETNLGLENSSTPEVSKTGPTKVKSESVTPTTAKTDKDTVSGLEPFSVLEKLYTISTNVKKQK